MKKYILVLTVLLAVMSCSTYQGINEGEQIQGKELVIVGEVSKEFKAYGIFGCDTVNSFVTFGTISSYHDLVEEARKMGADDVINIKEDIKNTGLMGILNWSTVYATGTAVKYN